jgi:hypothetical protein
LKPAWWGSLLFGEKCQGREKTCEKRITKMMIMATATTTTTTTTITVTPEA